MHKKSFTFGIGTGILAVTLLFYFVYGAQISKYKQGFANDLEMQKAQLQNENAAVEPTVKEIIHQPTDDEIIEKAKQLGMTFAQKEAATSESPEVTQPPEPIAAGNTENTENTRKPQAAVLDDTDAYSTVEIVEGNISSEIAGILQKAGVVDDAAAFDNFLTATGNTKKLAFGKFTIPKNLSYEEVLAIIKIK